jgi:hypothetical protein
MKQGKKKSERQEAGTESQGSDTIVPDNRDNPDGIDGIRALQMITGGIAILVLVWLILRNILHII